MTQSIDFSKILTMEIFIKSVLVCATETIFYVGVLKNIQVDDILNLVKLKAFDFWRLLNSFLKFDVQMPRSLSSHFREIEIKIVS